MEPPSEDRALSLDEAVSIAILLQQNEQWVGCGGHVPQHPRGRA